MNPHILQQNLKPQTQGLKPQSPVSNQSRITHISVAHDRFHQTLPVPEKLTSLGNQLDEFGQLLDQQKNESVVIASQSSQ